MSRSDETLYRQWVMLTKIPRYPRKTTVPELRNILLGEGYNIDTRTVQRDLNKLSISFPLSNDTEGRKNYWFWIEHAAIHHLPGMEPATALAFQMAESFLTPLLPQEILKLLAPYFSHAKEVLQASSTQLKNWPDKISVIDRGPPLKQPVIDRAIQNIIYQSLLEEKQIEASYSSRHSKNTSEHTLHPLGIVHRLGIIYLVCTFWSYTDVRQLALHRFKSAKILTDKIIPPKQFDLSEYLQEHLEFSYPINPEPIQLKVLFQDKTADHLHETPLSEDQVLTIQDDNRVLLEATVIDTHELRWWLSGFGNNVEIVLPTELRDHFVNQLRLMVQNYYPKTPQELIFSDTEVSPKLKQ